MFLFGVNGSVAKSTHAGITWRKRLRDEAGGRIHFWPFDGWVPASGKSVVAEVYPSIFRKRYTQLDPALPARKFVTTWRLSLPEGWKAR